MLWVPVRPSSCEPCLEARDIKGKEKEDNRVLPMLPV